MNRILIAILLCAALAGAADTSISGPVLGYAVDGNGVRPVYGIPGAALLGPVVDLGGRVMQAATANEAGLVMAALDDGRVVLFRGASASIIEDALPAPSRIAVSPRGRAALLYSEESRTIQIITGLTGTPKIYEPLPLEWSVAAMAISDTGRGLLAADDSLWWAMPGRSVMHMMRTPGTTAVAFFPGTNDVAFAHSGSLWTYRVGVTTAAGELSGVIALRAAGRALYAATPGGVSRVDLASGERMNVPCTCEVSELDPMRGGAVFRLNR